MKQISRRDALRNGSAGLFAVSTAGLAGCTGSIPGLGDEYEGPTLANWLFEPLFSGLFQEDDWREDNDYRNNLTLENDELTNQEFDYVVPKPIFEHQEELLGLGKLISGSGLRNRIGTSESETDWYLEQNFTFEFEYTYEEQTFSGETETVDRSTTSDIDVKIVSGSFEPDAVEDNLNRWAENKYDPDDLLDSEDQDKYRFVDEGEYEGYDLYHLETDNLGYAVDSNHVIEVQTELSPYFDLVAALEQVLDARWNAEQRWADADDAGELLRQYDEASFGNGQLYPVKPEDENLEDEIDDWEDGLMGEAESYELDGESTAFTKLYLYENQRDADQDALREHVETNRNVSPGSEFMTLEDYSISKNDRLLILSGTKQTSVV